MRFWNKTFSALLALGLLSVAGACGNGGDGPNPTPTPTPTPTPLTLNFGTPLSLAAGAVPAKAQGVVVGNFTDDNNLDFAVMNERFGVFVGKGDGTFEDRKDAAPIKSGATALALGEFDTTNSNIEIVVAFSSNNEVDIYVDPERDGLFSGTNFAAGTGPEGVAVADFDNDGLNDIALTNAGNNMRVKINDGAGGFTNLDFDTDGGLLTTARNLVAGDFNGDNFPDIAIADFGSDKLIVWINSGNALDLFPNANATGLDLPAASGVQGVTTADFNEDGFDDLVAPNPGPDNVSVFINNGNGTFGAITNYPAGNDPFGASTGDFNLDGNLDIVVANTFGVDGANGDFSVYLGDGNGGFAPQKTFTAGVDALGESNHPRSVAVGDFNGDGKPDIVMSSDLIATNTAVVVLNTSN